MGEEPLLVPQPPLQAHCWVWDHSRRGTPVPGVIVSWDLLQRPEMTVMTGVSGWMLQVAIQRAPGNLILSWVEESRVGPVRNRMPADGPRRGVRHVWRRPLREGMRPAPGLLMGWRRAADGWEAQVAMTRARGALLVDWEPADQVVPVADDSWSTPPELPRYPKRSRRG